MQTRLAWLGIVVLGLQLGACTSDSSSSDAPDVEYGRPEPDEDPTRYSPSLSVLAVYDVDTDEVVEPIDPEHEDEWARFTELIPAAYRPEVSYFVALDAEKSGGTDGVMGKSAVGEGAWYVGLDVTGFSVGTEFDRTVIHEYAHLLTLRVSQYESDAEECDTYTDEPGCPAEGSYLRDFYLRFWPGATLDAIDGEEPDPEGFTVESAERFATGEYVTEYAATRPSEDIAEIFAEWVLMDGEASGDSVVAQKLQFFDAYPEVVEIKAAIRDAL